MLSNNTLQT